MNKFLYIYLIPNTMLILIPFNGGALGRKGQEKAPKAIVEELEKYEVLLNTTKNKLIDITPQEIGVNNNNIEESFKAIEQAMDKALSQSSKPIIIGGDHSITYPLMKGILKKYPNAGVISFDAHPDLEPSTIIPSHDSWLRKLIEEGLNNIILLGVRYMGLREAELLREKNIMFFTPEKIEMDRETIADIVMSKAKEWEKVWVTIDIDVLDPSFAPGTFYNEPFGLSSLTLLYFLRRLSFLKNIVGYDLVEVNPELDIHGITSRIAARIISELL